LTNKKMEPSMSTMLDHRSEFISHSAGIRYRFTPVSAAAVATRIEAPQPVRNEPLVENAGDEAGSAPADIGGNSNLAASAITAVSLATAIFLLICASWTTWQLVAMFLERASHFSQLELMRALAGA
jgi:hypothetical protein